MSKDMTAALISAAITTPTGTPTGTPAPYGRACRNCSRAKCRCMYRVDGDGCERCHRLNKECQPAVPVRRRGAGTRKAGSAGLSRTAQLEQKLDGLVSLLAAHGGAMVGESDSGSNRTTPGLGEEGPGIPGAAIKKPNALTTATTTPASAATGSCLPQTPESAAAAPSARRLPLELTGEAVFAPADEPTAAEAEACLATFRDEMLAYFPFVDLDGVTSDGLRRTRPLLWLAVMAVVCRHVPWRVQQARSQRLRVVFAQRAVVACEKNVDLLLAMLAYMAWVHFSARRDRPTLALMSHMAVALAGDLGLHRSSGPPCRVLLARFMRDRGDIEVDHGAALEDRRAALGCYVLSSVLALSLRRTDPMRWTGLLEEHVQLLLAAAAADPTSRDHILVAQVRLQRLSDHVYQGDWQLTDAALAGPSTSPAGLRSLYGHRAVPPYVARVLYGKLEEIQAAVPAGLQNHDGLCAPLLCAEMLLAASVVTTGPPEPLPAEPLPAAAASLSAYMNYAAVANAAHLDRCVDSVARFCTYFLGIPSSAYPVVPFSYYTYFTSCLMLLHSLAAVEDPAWDRASERGCLSALDMLDGFTVRLRDAPRPPPVPGTAPPPLDYDDDVFTRAATLVAALREQWAAEGAGDVAASGMASGTAPGMTSGTNTATGTTTGTTTNTTTTTTTTTPSNPPLSVAQPSAQAWPAEPAPPPVDQLMPIQTVEMFYPDFFQAMGMTEDSLFWDAFLGQDAPTFP